MRRAGILTFALLCLLPAPARGAQLYGVTGSGYPFDFSSVFPAPATAPVLSRPIDVAALPDGGFLIADQGFQRLDRVSPQGVISVVHDSSAAGPGQLGRPTGVAVAADGTWLVASADSDRVYAVAAGGAATPVAGTGDQGYSGDGGLATAAELSLGSPDDRARLTGLAALPNGGVLIADTGNNVVREVLPAGLIVTVAGTGTPGFSGDGGPAVAARLNGPQGVAVAPDGGILITDSGNHRVRRVAPDGSISTVAGNGNAASYGDGGLAVAAALQEPSGVAALPGGFVVADSGAGRLRAVGPDGRITSVAVAVHDFSRRTLLAEPLGIALTGDGGLLAATGDESRVVYVAPAAPGRLAVAITALRARPRALSVAFQLSQPAAVEVDVHQAGRVLARVRMDAPAGLGRAVVRGALPAGPVAVRVLASQPGRAFAADEVRGVVTSATLRPALARRMLGPSCCGEGDEAGGSEISFCAPVTSRRVDCEVDSYVRARPTGRVSVSCANFTALRLAPSGVVTGRDYRCPAPARPAAVACRTGPAPPRCRRRPRSAPRWARPPYVLGVF